MAAAALNLNAAAIAVIQVIVDVIAAKRCDYFADDGDDGAAELADCAVFEILCVYRHRTWHQRHLRNVYVHCDCPTK